MALQPQNISVPLSQGLDTKSDPKQLSFGKLTVLTNRFFQTLGMLRKRFGFTALTKTILGGNTITGASSVVAGTGLASFQNDIVTTDGQSLFTYSPDSPGWTQVPGTLQTLSVSAANVYRTLDPASNQDSAYHAAKGYYAYAWYDTTAAGILYSIVDGTTGSTLVSGNTLGLAINNVKVTVVGNYFVFFYIDQNTGHLIYAAFDVTAPANFFTPTSSSTVASDVNATTPAYDVCSDSAQNKVFIAYNTSAGGGAVALYSLSNALVLSSKITKATENADCITVWAQGTTNVWVAYQKNAVGVRYFIYDAALVTQVLAPTTAYNASVTSKITGAFVGTEAGSQYSVFVLGITSAQIVTVYFNIVGTSLVSAFNTPMIGMYVSSKVFSVDTKHQYFIGGFYSAVQPTNFLMNAYNGDTVAKILPGTAYVNTDTGFDTLATKQALPAVNLVSSGVYQFALLQNEPSFLDTVTGSTPVGLTQTTVNFNATPQMLEMANGLYISGGFLSIFDGSAVYEHNFHLFPEAPSNLTQGAGGHIADGVYSYLTLYAWVDNQGNTHISAPSVPTSITVTGGSGTASVSLRSRALYNTGKPPVGTSSRVPIAMWIYRTAAAGTIYYRIDDGTVFNIRTGGYVTYNDTLADASITGSNQLYTTGGELEDASPPAVMAMCAYKNRLFVIPSDSPNELWYSKEIIAGFAAEFSASLTMVSDKRFGNNTALTQLDDKLIIAKSGSLYYTAGNGPAPNGTGNDYFPPLLIASDCGVTEQSSSVVTGNGWMFRSAKGITLLDRSLSVSYIGWPVEGLEGNTLTSATLVGAYNHVRFTQANGAALVLDYFSNQWSDYTPLAAVGACLFQGVYTWLDSAGQVWQESTSFTDNGAQITSTITTGWLSFAGLQGFQRLYKLMIVGDYKSSHTLKIQIAYDYDPTIVQTDNIVTSSTPPYQYRVFLQRQKCEAIQITISDTNDTGEAMDLSAIAFEVGVKSGLNRLPQNSSAG